MRRRQRCASCTPFRVTSVPSSGCPYLSGYRLCGTLPARTAARRAVAVKRQFFDASSWTCSATGSSAHQNHRDSDRSSCSSLRERESPRGRGLPGLHQRYSGGGIRTRDLRVMSPCREFGGVRWSSSKPANSRIGSDRVGLGSAGYVAPGLPHPPLARLRSTTTVKCSPDPPLRRESLANRGKPSKRTGVSMCWASGTGSWRD
jgi:hypothetical protein